MIPLRRALLWLVVVLSLIPTLALSELYAPADSALRRADHDVLLVSRDHGTWFVHVSSLPNMLGTDKPGPCTVTLQVAPEEAARPQVECESFVVAQLLRAAVSGWGVLEIEPADSPGEVSFEVWFEKWNGSAYPAHVINHRLRDQLAGRTPEPFTPSGNITVRRRVEPLIYDLIRDEPAPIYSTLRFDIDAQGKPTQLTILEAPSKLWRPICKAGWNWRFTLPDGKESGVYKLALTFKRYSH